MAHRKSSENVFEISDWGKVAGNSVKILWCESWGIWVLSLGLPSTNLCEPEPQFYTNTVTNNSNVRFLSTSYHPGTLHV